jgi:hypothetical protein
VIADDLGAVVVARYDSIDESGISVNSRRNMLWIMSISLLSKCGCSSGFAKELIINLL